MKLAELGEFGLIERIRRQASTSAAVLLGIGDDCAVIAHPAGQALLTTTDMLIEGVHFRLDWTEPEALGRKSVAVNVSDIAAMGGVVNQLYLGLGLPEQLPVALVERFIDGVLAGVAEYGAVLAGGDTCRSPGPLIISVTAEGTAPVAEVVTRSGARAGNGIYVSGTVGDSALALRQLLQGEVPPAALARRHHQPQARADLGRRLAAGRLVTAMIDLSDGVLADLGHVLKASGCGAEIQAACLPLSEGFAAALAADPALWEVALSGGEDYELLFTAPPAQEPALAALAATLGLPVTRIGTVLAPNGMVVKGRDGRVLPHTAGGFDHFSRRR